MVERCNSSKFGINLLDGFWKIRFYGQRRDGRRMTDARVTTVALMCSSIEQTELKCRERFLGTILCMTLHKYIFLLFVLLFRNSELKSQRPRKANTKKLYPHMYNLGSTWYDLQVNNYQSTIGLKQGDSSVQAQPCGNNT